MIGQRSAFGAGGSHRLTPAKNGKRREVTGFDDGSGSIGKTKECGRRERHSAPSAHVAAREGIAEAAERRRGEDFKCAEVIHRHAEEWFRSDEPVDNLLSNTNGARRANFSRNYEKEVQEMGDG